MNVKAKQIPVEFTLRDCYERIYSWHQKYGIDYFVNWVTRGRKVRLLDEQDANKPYINEYGFLIEAMPSPETASDGDMYIVLTHQIRKLLEWSVFNHEKNAINLSDDGYSLFELAKFIITNPDHSRERVEEAMKQGTLYEKFKVK